jgi:dihydroxyacetone kinase phosphotransfer subunit
MVGIVIVSHSQKLAEGVAEIAKMMAADAVVIAAGGMDDGGLGTSYSKINEAVESADTGAGAIILVDMGSAVMTAEMVLEDRDDGKSRLVDCPLVEGAVVAALEALQGSTIEQIALKAEAARQTKKIMA